MNKLPVELKDLVHKSVSLLGEVILEEGGEELFNTVEVIRLKMIEYRKSSTANKSRILDFLYEEILKCKKENKHAIAQSFTLMLELINSCEAAFRTFRLKKINTTAKSSKEENSIVYVLTAHPTEARSPKNIELFARIQNVMTKLLDKSREEEYLLSIIKHNLKIAWLVPVTRHEKPSVVDEAKHLFSIILRPDIFDAILRGDRDLGTIKVRTWVGGDKDGHPGVDEKVMLDCLQISRTYFIKIVNKILSELMSDVSYLDQVNLTKKHLGLVSKVNTLKKISSGDSQRLHSFNESLEKFNEEYVKIVGMQSPRVKKLKSILIMFPGLVVPLELREDSAVIKESLNSLKDLSIVRMLKKLEIIARKGNVRNYAQGMIISMCQSYSDVENAIKLVENCLGNLSLPVIPLFETAAALNDSSIIVSRMLKNQKYMKNVRQNWSNKLEIMLGYSDSSKGMGVLPSRIAIAKTMTNLDLLIRKERVIPIFFHGSGGSVDRGGGSILEQTSWWPNSALRTYKATIQGEMIERNFSSSEIAISGMDKILSNFKKSQVKETLITFDSELELFAENIKNHYVEKISDDSFFEMVTKATPYSYLSLLKLGSRPSKRSSAKVLDFSSIRAIPWILCWTQTRLLFPTWWGVGFAWRQIKESKKRSSAILKSYNENLLFASYIRTLGFTLSKVDLSIFKLYLKKSSLSAQSQTKAFVQFEEEYKSTVDFLNFLTKQKNLLWHKPWLAESIELRSSMIHPLNIIQIQANLDSDESLVRKTVAGISSGMLTTG